MVITGIRNATLIIEKSSCLPINGNFITLLTFTIREKNDVSSLSSSHHPRSKREEPNQTELVKGIIFVSKELMR